MTFNNLASYDIWGKQCSSPKNHQGINPEINQYNIKKTKPGITSSRTSRIFAPNCSTLPLYFAVTWEDKSKHSKTQGWYFSSKPAPYFLQNNNYHQSNLQHAEKRQDVRRSITNPKTVSFTSCEYFTCCAYLLEQAHTLHPSVRFHRLSFVNYEIRKKTWNEKKVHLCTCIAVLPPKMNWLP